MLDGSRPGVGIGAGTVKADCACSTYNETVCARNYSRKFEKACGIAPQREAVLGQREVAFEKQRPGAGKDEKEVLRARDVAAFHGYIELDIVHAVGLIALDAASRWSGCATDSKAVSAQHIVCSVAIHEPQ